MIGQVDGKATDTLLWPVEGQDPLWSTHDRLFDNTHLKESTYPSEHDGMPGTEGGQGGEKSFVAETANALLLEMTQFSPNSMIYWAYDLHSSFSFLSLLFLFYEMGLIKCPSLQCCCGDSEMRLYLLKGFAPCLTKMFAVVIFCLADLVMKCSVVLKSVIISTTS